MIRRGFDPAAETSRAERAAFRSRKPGVPALVQTLRARRPERKDGTVIIIGAGMSGLTAAFELERLGFKVVVLEADESHVGGRVRTLRFGDRYGEAGAMRIPTDHDLTRFYVGAFGLQLRKFVQTNGEGFLLARGRRVRMKDAPAVLSQYNLTSGEVKLGDVGLWKETVGKLAAGLKPEEVADLTSDRIATPRMQLLDRQSLYAYWAQHPQHPLSPGAIQLLASTWNLETSLHISMTEHVREEFEGTWEEGFDEIVGGMDSLPTAFAKSLKRPVASGCPVVEVVRDENGITATHACRNGEHKEVRGDWLICTVPLTVLHRIEFRPALSPKKRDAIRRISYDSSTKVLALTKRRFWETEDGIFGGGSVSDGALGSTWYPSDNADQPDPAKSAAPSIFLASYSWGQTARRMTKDAEREVLVPELARLHDSLLADPSLIEKQVRWSWDEHPWSAGAYCFCQPGEQLELFEVLVAPEGRMLLAGEHASFNHSWIQGAIFSGLRAALHIAENHK